MLTPDGSTGGAADPAAIRPEYHAALFDDLWTAIAEDRDVAVTGEEGRKSVELILAIFQSAWTGKVVKLPLKKSPKPPKK